ncbi:MAG TPA: hypothetical protein VGM39_24775 [Kofleriaceae bacterium]|jgi:hypothetical protein
MVFDRSTELPAARVVVEPRTLPELVGGGIAVFFRAHWRWLRPRMIPVIVAALSLVAVMQAVNYLAHPPAAKWNRPGIAASASGGVPYDVTRIHLVVQQ